MGLAGGAVEVVHGPGSWMGCSMQAQRQPKAQDKCGCQEGGLEAPGMLDRKTQTVSEPRC